MGTSTLDLTVDSSRTLQEKMCKVTALIIISLVSTSLAEYEGSCQVPGNAICFLSDLPEVKLAPCCPFPGIKCLPWTGAGYIPSDKGPEYYCQYVEDIPAGGDCSKQKGSCDASSSCVDGLCVNGSFRVSVKHFVVSKPSLVISVVIVSIALILLLRK